MRRSTGAKRIACANTTASRSDATASQESLPDDVGIEYGDQRLHVAGAQRILVEHAWIPPPGAA
jgi:hypothetical protein